MTPGRRSRLTEADRAEWAHYARHVAPLPTTDNNAAPARPPWNPQAWPNNETGRWTPQPAFATDR